MAGLFCNSPELQRLEKQMRQPPGYRARGHGSIEDMSEWKEMGAYSEIVDYVIDRMHLEYLKKESVRSSIRQRMNSFSMTVTTKKILFIMVGIEREYIVQITELCSYCFLLSADEKLWEKHAGRCQIPEFILIKFGWEVLLWNNIFCSMRQKMLIMGQSISACRN